jgi:hypothetical protein
LQLFAAHCSSCHKNITACSVCGVKFEKDKEKNHKLFECTQAKKYKCECGAILNKTEATISGFLFKSAFFFLSFFFGDRT